MPRFDTSVRMWCPHCLEATKSKDCPSCRERYTACAKCARCTAHAQHPDEDGREDQ